jgi:hypothetical protein
MGHAVHPIVTYRKCFASHRKLEGYVGRDLAHSLDLANDT